MKSALLQTRLNGYTQAIQKAYGCDNAAQQFSLTEPMEIKLRKAILESDGLLSEIATLDVDQIVGQVVNVGVGALLTGRGDGERFKGSLGKDGHQFKLADTDSCMAITWQELSVWGNSGTEGQFKKLLTDNGNRGFGLDILKIGFNGTAVARPTNPSANPLGQDVNVGWQAYVKEHAPNQVITAPVYLDAAGNGTYKNLDSLVQDLINSLIDPVFQNDPNLVVLVGRDLVAAEQHRLLEAADSPVEHKAAQTLAKTIAGRRAIVPPFFPGKRIAVTFLKNLQVLTQKGSRRRKVKDHDDRMQLESTYWRNEGYAVGVFEAYAAIDEAAMVIGPRPSSVAEDGADAPVSDIVEQSTKSDAADAVSTEDAAAQLVKGK
ncbi:phage major capsid protein, P2 family [Ferrimonas senticii]|uniref:phage major capsid protein, P2 family n=1 Tax=Ferrimonas senticii TaxID=394566 RepID=UPI0003F9EAE0|nr:phage major capsid protein, P2 family [Ferrimonas senticii]